MQSIAISQPTYLPWIGYFNIIDRVNSFVFLDIVQFDKRSWQQRNKIKTPNGLEYISVPVIVKGKHNQKIHEVRIQMDSKFPKNHLRSFEFNYNKSPFYSEYIEDITKIFLKTIEHQSLSILNSDIIKFICNTLKIKTKILHSTELKISGKGSELLISICDLLKSNNYLSAKGAINYLKEDKLFFDQSNIKISLVDYKHPKYMQRFGKFIPYACIFDLLFNEGQNSLNIIRSGCVPDIVL